MPSMCGVRWIAGPPGSDCGDGTTSTPIQQPSGPNTATGTGVVPSSADSRPVAVGWDTEPAKAVWKDPSAHTVRTPIQTNVYAAQSYVQDLRGKGGKEYKEFVSKLRRWSNQKLGTVSAIDSAWHEVLQTAASSGRNALDILDGNAVPGGNGDGGTGSGSGVYRGPVTTVTTYNDADLRVIADTIGSTVLGRGLSNDEYAAIKSKVRTAERENPSISGGGVASQTNQAGISQQGREDVIRRALLQQDGAKEFTLATKMMGLFDQALQERPDAGQ